MAIINVNENWYTIIDTESTNVSNFNSRESSSVITFLVKQDQIFTFINDVLGSAKLQNNSFVTRVIPASHPLFPWQYAYKIESIKGYTPDGKQDSNSLKAETTFKNIDVDVPAYGGSYKYYKITVRFTTRDYNIYTNEQLSRFNNPNRNYFMPIRLNFTGDWGEREETYIYRNEEARYVNVGIERDISILNYGGGNFWQKFSDQVPPGQAKELPISMDNNGINNIQIVKYNLSVNWFFVPFEMSIRNQLWTEGYNKINLYPFLNYKKGSLLFKEINIKKYDPYYPFQNIDISSTSSVFDYFTEYNKNQYMDVTFKFVYFRLPAGVIVQPSGLSYWALQCKDVNSAHNVLLSPRDLNWYYFESQPASGAPPIANKKAAPLYWNFDHSRLFTYVEGA